MDIESITNHEEAVGSFVSEILSGLASRTGGRVERCTVEPHRFNVFAYWDTPIVTLSTHMDTVPPFFLSKEDDEFIWGRGSADAKGIIASMIGAAENLLASGTKNFGLLFVVGEERNSAGAYAAARDPRGSRFLINGEPTENKLALAAKGILRYEVETTGRLAHSAYPELGESAIDKLLDVLQDIRKILLPHDELLGRSTLNVGVIAGGHAPNVVADSARAEIAIRLVDDGDATRDAVQQAVAAVPPPASSSQSANAFWLTGWTRLNNRRLHHGHSDVRWCLGPAVSARTRQHSRGPHARRTRPQKRTHCSRRNLRKDGQAASRCFVKT